MSEAPPPNPNPSPTPAPASSPTPPNPEPANTPPPSPLAADAPPAAPLDIEKLTLPEGFERGEQFSKFTNIAKEFGISQPKAQELVGLHAEAITAAVKASVDKLTESWNEQQVKWQREVDADQELGGERLKEVKQIVGKVLDNAELTDPKFRDAIISTGAGNNPAVVRTLYRWAKALTEGGSVQGDAPARNANGSVDNQRPSVADAIYGPAGPHSGGPKLS